MGAKRKFVASRVAIAPLLVALPVSAQPGIVINEDDSHFFGSRKPEDMSIEGLHAFVDQYADTRVSHLFLCPNAQKASHDSAVLDAIWELGEGQRAPEEGFAKQWCDNARLLHERGLDPYAIWIARCREKGISPWLSMRMNDVHNVDDPDSYIHASFWREHPEYWRVPGSTGGWVDRAFDFGIAEVRAHHRAYLRELFERYDPDGIELDWMRFGYHFKPGHEAEGTELLTQFMRDARALAKEWSAKRGHPILIGARVPAHPDAAIGLGMDGIRWAKEGLIDRLVPTPFWATTDFDIPIELWRARLGDAAKGIVLCAGGEILLRAHPGGGAVENDLASTRGFAAAHLHRGADQIYLFNYMDPDPMRGPAGSYRKLLTEGFDLEAMKNQPRRHPLTYRDTVPASVPNGAQLPAAASEQQDYIFYIGPKPTGEVALVAGFDQPISLEAMQVKIEVNKTESSVTPVPAPSHAALLPDGVQPVALPLKKELFVDGANTLTLRVANAPDTLKLVWLELALR